MDSEELIREGTDFGVDGYEDFLSFWESMVEVSFYSLSSRGLHLTNLGSLPQGYYFQRSCSDALLP
jgi:hypothetical protein